MSGKRLVIGVLCTVCVTLGLYLTFFNHQSADELLKMNRQDTDDSPLPARPHFHHLKSPEQHQNRPAEDAETGTKHDNEDNGRLLFVVKTEIRTPSQEKLKVEAGNDENHRQQDEHRDSGGDDDDNIIKDDDDTDVEPEKKQEEEEVADDNEVPVERVENPVDGNHEDEENEQQVEAGGNGGETEAEGDGEMPGGGDGSRVNQDGRGPHGIKIFDWDKWVKDNDFVELGNIWGYCDDEDPPVIGKVLLLPDEDEGGLKNVIIFNTTFEYDVVLGSVDVSIEYGGMSFFTKKFPLEDLETEAEFFKCPIVKGDHYFVREQHLSALVPKGEYYGEAKMFDQNGKVLVCSQMNMKIN